VSSPDHPVSVHRRWTVLTITRIVLAGAVIGSVSIMSDLAGVRQDAVVVSCGVYAGLVLGVELLRRATGARALWLVGLLIIIDGLFLARVVNTTGGTLSPLNALVYLHIVAITLVVSFRVGLEAAVWHAALVVITASEAGAAIVGSSLWSVPGEVTLRVATYLAVAIAAATYASLDERALRRTQAHLADQVDLLSALEESQTVDAAALVVGDHVVAGLGFTRAAVLVSIHGQTRVVVVEHGDGAIHHALADMPLAAPPAGADEAHEAGPVLLGSLDPEANPELDRLLPNARDLVVVPLVVQEGCSGSIVAEWPSGHWRRIPWMVLDQLQIAARYGGMALRSSLLLAEVEDRSLRDTVTGLANRRAFDNALESEISRSRRSGSATSVVLLDLDRFKQVNDTEGHQVGDSVLAAVGRALEEAARPHDLVARIGGDEFAILLADCVLPDAALVADRARRAVWDSVGDRGVTTCAGVAASIFDRKPSDVLRRADQALYQAKAAGQNRVSTAPALPDRATVIDLADERTPQVLEDTHRDLTSN
jgi:two-component system cell cycle response regulator